MAKQTTHINLEQLARRMILAGVNNDNIAAQLVPPHQVLTQEQYHAALVEKLREERRAMVDFQFRRRFWKYIG